MDHQSKNCDCKTHPDIVQSFKIEHRVRISHKVDPCTCKSSQYADEHLGKARRGSSCMSYSHRELLANSSPVVSLEVVEAVDPEHC